MRWGAWTGTRLASPFLRAIWKIHIGKCVAKLKHVRLKTWSEGGWTATLDPRRDPGKEIGALGTDPLAVSIMHNKIRMHVAGFKTFGYPLRDTFMEWVRLCPILESGIPLLECVASSGHAGLLLRSHLWNLGSVMVRKM